MSEEQSLVPSSTSHELDIQTRQLIFSNNVKEAIFHIISAFPDQKQLIRWDDVPTINKEQRRILASFGIIIGNPDVVDLSDRNYLLIVDPNWGMDLELNIQKFVQAYLPPETEPTHYVINGTIDSYESFLMWLNRMQSLYPGIQALTDESRFVEQNLRSSYVEEMYEEARSNGFTPYTITPKLAEIANEYRLSNSKTLRLLRELEEDILAFRKANPNTILMSSGDAEGSSSSSGFTGVVAAYIFYKHGIPCHLPKPHTSLYLTQLAHLYFDPDRMLFEEQVNYFKSLPSVAICFDQSQSHLFFVYVNREMINCKFLVSYMDIENPRELHRAEMNLHQMTIIPLADEYDLDTPNPSLFRINHDKLLQLYVKYTDLRKDMGSSMLDVTNTCLLEIDGRKKLAYIENAELNVPCVFTPVGTNLPRFNKNMGVHELRRLLPINCLPGYKQTLGRYMKEVIGILNRNYPEQAAMLQRNMAVFPRNPKRALGGLVDGFYNYGPNVINISDVNDYLTIGLWWGETYTYRVGFAKRLYPMLKINETRKFNSFFSIFGGPVPFFMDPLEFREEVLN